MRKFQFLVPFLLVLMPHVTQAQVNDDGLIVATCTNGQGCSCYLSDATLAVLETQVSTPPPDGVAHPVLVYIDGTISWSDRSGHEVDMIYGGDGLCDPEIFTPSDWRPRDGVWLMAIERQGLEGCPPQIASAMSIASEIGLTERRTITWPHPFSPAPLAPTALAFDSPGIPLSSLL